MSAFFLYSQAFRSVVKEESPEASFGDIVSHGKCLFARALVYCNVS